MLPMEKVYKVVEHVEKYFDSLEEAEKYYSQARFRPVSEKKEHFDVFLIVADEVQDEE